MNGMFSEGENISMSAKFAKINLTSCFVYARKVISKVRGGGMHGKEAR